MKSSTFSKQKRRPTQQKSDQFLQEILTDVRYRLTSRETSPQTSSGILASWLVARFSSTMLVHVPKSSGRDVNWLSWEKKSFFFINKEKTVFSGWAEQGFVGNRSASGANVHLLDTSWFIQRWLETNLVMHVTNRFSWTVVLALLTTVWLNGLSLWPHSHRRHKQQEISRTLVLHKHFQKHSGSLLSWR